MSIVQKLTEGIVREDRRKATSKLVQKWKKMRLLEGLESDLEVANMAMLLENQAKEILREQSSMSAGDVEGFASVAFPLVRRIFGRVIATKLVSIQPMSLPAGLIFFLDFQYTRTKMANIQNQSVYGQGRVGREIVSGALVDDSGSTRYGEMGFYGLHQGYSHASASLGSLMMTSAGQVAAPFIVGDNELSSALIQWDPNLATGSYAAVYDIPLTLAQWDLIAGDQYIPITASFSNTLTSNHSGSTQVRKLTSRVNNNLRVVFHGSSSFGALSHSDGSVVVTIGYPRKDAWTTPSLGAIVGTTPWELEAQNEIPEIDIKVDQIPITAVTRKLKATWTQELAQDINAFHNLDSEVELTTVLSDHVELEINNEILGDLVKGAVGTYYWSRRPGKFVNRQTGEDLTTALAPPDFTGNVSEWYQTLLETVNDASAQIFRKIRKGGANFIVCGPEVCSILEMTAGFRASVAVDDEMGDAGVIKAGTLSRKWDIYVDPNFYRNVLLVGRKGSGFLESGYVYAPYVPLQVTPTVLHQENFTPRKAVYTRYAKKMVRPDFYHLVIVENLLG